MDKFQFYSGSADAKPGLGAGERLSGEVEYAELAKIHGWRRVLSNFWVGPFVWKGRRWNTVEHAFQAAKFETLDPAFFERMSLDSGSALAAAGGLDARKQRKHIVLTKEQLADWGQRSGAIMTELLEAKFTQDETSRKVLAATGSAELWHYAGRSQGVEHWTNLEGIRAQIR